MKRNPLKILFRKGGGRICFFNRAVLVLGLASCVLFVSASGTQAEEELEFTPIATAEVNERGDETEITIEVRGAAPDTFYTVWIRLNGSSPLTGAGSTAMAPTTAIDDLSAVTPDPAEFNTCFAKGSEDVINGFFTDEQGNGTLEVTLDFPLSAGCYPFPAASCIPFKRQGAGGATLRIVSHCFDQCCDQIGHGLVAGPHEVWFNWELPEEGI